MGMSLAWVEGFGLQVDFGGPKTPLTSDNSLQLFPAALARATTSGGIGGNWQVYSLRGEDRHGSGKAKI